MLCECLFLNRQWIRINITLVKYSMNELYAKRLDCIPAVMWVPQVQAKEAQRLAPAVHELNLVVSLIVTTLVMTRTWENNSAPFPGRGEIRTFVGIVYSRKGWG